MDYDDVLKQLGEFGPYQRRITLLLSLIAIPCGLHTGAMTFIAAIPDHHCRVAQTTLPGYNLTWPEALNLSIPMEEVEGKWRLSRCRKYDRAEQFGSFNRTTSTCTEGWEYDHSQYHSSVVTEYHLVCDRAWLRELAQSIFMAGVGLGGIFFGFLADRLGRHVTLMTCLMLQLTFAVGVAFSSNLITFIALRFMVGAFSNGAYYAAFVIGIESLGPSKRALFGMTMSLSAVGYLLLGLLAYFIRDWWLLQLVLSFSTLPLLLYWWFILESPRWLIVHKKTVQSRKVIERIAKENGVNFPQEVFEKLNGCSKPEPDRRGSRTPGNSGRRYSLVDLVRTPQMRKISTAMNAAWLISVCVYYSLMLGTSQLIGDHYVNFVLGSCVEIVAVLISWRIMARWGRKRPAVVSMLFAGISCVATAAVPHDLGPVTIALAMAGRFGISIGFCTLHVYAAEVFPTVIRTLGVGQACFVSRVGGVVAPFIGLLGNVWRPLPFLMYGVLCCMAGLALIALPETHGMPLPNTPEDLENFGSRRASRQSTETEPAFSSRRASRQSIETEPAFSSRRASRQPIETEPTFSSRRASMQSIGTEVQFKLPSNTAAVYEMVSTV